MNWPEVQALLSGFKTKHVLLIGDTILDRNVTCRVRGISAETPTMVLEELDRKETLGGAACVERNLKELRANCTFVTRDMAEKTRFWVDDHKMLQVDKLSKPLPESYHIEIRRSLEWKLKKDGSITVVADYRHGFIEETTARFIVEHAKGPLFVSSQVSQETSNHHWYDGKKTFFVSNNKEAEGIRLDPRFSIVSYRGWVITHGPIGANRYGKFSEGFTEHCPAIPVTSVVDTCGAGDAFLAAYCLSESLEFANIWAGLSCTVHGANPPTLAMLEKWVKDHAPA